MIFLELDRKFFILTAVFSIILLTPVIDAEASGNANLFVSAENSQFDNYMAGPMVIEVVVIDSDISDTNEGKGEPDVTVQGKSLRMAQATDGNWYGYFANLQSAQAADRTQPATPVAGTTEGKGLDFGMGCDAASASALTGITLTQTKGVYFPKQLAGTNAAGNLASDCALPGTTKLSHVIRENKTLNANVATGNGLGQLNLPDNTWPFVQLFDLNPTGSVNINYNKGGGTQSTTLTFDTVDQFAYLESDRDVFPTGAQIQLTMTDLQLNIDPTDEDSWTWGTLVTNNTAYYQLFDEDGNADADGTDAAVNLIPVMNTDGFMFEDNGKLLLDIDTQNSGTEIVRIVDNDDSNTNGTSTVDASTVATDGGSITKPNQPVTFTELIPNSGIFTNYDNSDVSNLAINTKAPRGKSATVDYNDMPMSILTGFVSATLSLETPTLTIGNDLQSLKPGTKYSVVLVDPDQNFSSGSRDDLDAFRSSSIIPTMRIGNPATLELASDVKFFISSTDPPPPGNPADSSVPDPNSARLIIDTSTVPNGNFEKISLNLGVSASELQSLFIDTSLSDSDGTNWLNYDLRSFTNDLEILDFTDTSIELSFGSLGASPVTIVDSGDLSSAQDFVQLDDSDIQDIFDKSGTVFVVINFDSSNDDVGVGNISDEDDLQPIIFDFFSFGLDNFVDNLEIRNNAIYRFELEETSNNSATFDGTLEYAVANQLNVLDPLLIQTLRPINDDVKFFITDRLVDNEGISISYSDIDEVGIVVTKSTKSDINTHSGIPSFDSTSYRFGQPVTVTLNDPDLNLKNDLVEIYFVIDDPTSENVDTVGKDGVILLEILFGDIRYERCTVDGVEYGGLGATGFTLVETGPSTGIFEGVFKIPSETCNKSGTDLISSAGRSLNVKYFDARDSSGNSNTFSFLREKPSSSLPILPQLSVTDVVKPLSGAIEEVVLSGGVKNHRSGLPLIVTITYPDGRSQNFESTLTNNGSYKSVISINENSLSGFYDVELSHNNSHVGKVSFVVFTPEIPDWIKNNAKWWSSASISDSEFIDGIEYMIEEGFMKISPTERSSTSEQEIPDWIKNNAKWWADDTISDEDFIKSIQYLVKKGIILI